MNVAQLFVSPDISLRDVMRSIDRSGKQIALVVDGEQRLLATITDGDIRRAILANVDLESPAQTLLHKFDPSQGGMRPTTAPAGTSRAQLVHLMNEKQVRHVPLVDPTGRVVDIASLDEIAAECEAPLQAVIMAGGFGTRLRPLTDNVPKPMLPIGNRPLLEHTLERLQKAGIRKVNVTTHYKGNVIEQHFGDGKGFGVDINYVQEDEPLGTAGALGFLENQVEPVLVMNGDILTDINFRSLREYHREQRADMTIAVRRYDLKVPYGVVESDGTLVTGITEKPTIRHFVSAGIYLLNPAVPRLVASGQRCDMPDLIRKVIGRNGRVVSFPISEYWLDIGQVADYEQAQADLEAGRIER